MIINAKEYRNKVLGCWMGKNIGGTLGEPFEWRRQLNDVSFYVQELHGEARPNDDLDLQLAWLLAVEQHGPRVDAKILAEYWLNYITPHWVEYGNAKTNLRMGLLPPLSGYYCNPWRDSCGAYIRSEIWACLAPGCPTLAGRLSYEDAIVDHGGGEGVYAEVFSAAVESAAFLESDLRKLVAIGLSVIPQGCGVARAVRLAMQCYDEGISWKDARLKMLEKLGNFRPGWDVPSNIGMLMIGWLYGEGDFGKSLCIAVNCGEDTDCTAATLGSILGIIGGIDSIPEEWKAPIGRKINTLTLNRADHWNIPGTVDELTDRVVRQAPSVLTAYGASVVLDPEAETDGSGFNYEELTRPGRLGDLWSRPVTAIPFDFAINSALLDYVEGPEIKSGEAKTIKLTMWRRTPGQQVLKLAFQLPKGWQVLPGATTSVCLYDNQTDPQPEGTFPRQYKAVLEFTILPGELDEAVYRGGISITCHDRPSTGYIPLTFVNGTVTATQG